jgi:hypothetical protein
MEQSSGCLAMPLDKDGLLPDVVDLQNNPNKTQGLGSWDAWEKGEGRQGQADPYYEWFAELKANPVLDALNAEIERHRKAD